jgi:hypothetical protein
MSNGRPKIRVWDFVVVLMPPAAAIVLCLMVGGAVPLPGRWIVDNVTGWCSAMAGDPTARGFPNTGWYAGRECFARLVDRFSNDRATPLKDTFPAPRGLSPPDPCMPPDARP